MKVSVAYQIIEDVEIEVNDRFRQLIDCDDNFTNREWCRLQDELIEKVYGKIPKGADIISIYDVDTDEALFEN